jgi:hypothetical protein
MGFNNISHVLHAAVADFGAVTIEYLVQLASSREMLIQELQECARNIGFDTPAVRGVKPNNFSRSVLLSSSGVVLVLLSIFYLLCIPTRCESINIHGRCFLEYLPVRRYPRYSLLYRIGNLLDDLGRMI